LAGGGCDAPAHTHSEAKTFGQWPGIKPETTSLSGEEKVMPTAKHPENIHVWSLSQFCPKTLKKEWYQNALQEQLLPTVQERFVTMSQGESDHEMIQRSLHINFGSVATGQASLRILIP